MTLLSQSIVLLTSLSVAFFAQASENVFSPHESVIVNQENIKLALESVPENPDILNGGSYAAFLKSRVLSKLPSTESLASHRQKMLSNYEYFTPAHTQKAIKNMQESGGKKGLFYVHGIEPFANWVGEFSDERMAEFIEGYPELLSKRYLIAGSVIAFNGVPKTTLSETFTPFGYIMSFSPESIAATSMMDMGSPVKFSQKPNIWPETYANSYCCTKTLNNPAENIPGHYSPGSLSQLIHHPAVYTFDSALKDENPVVKHRNAMNEVALFTGLRMPSGEICHPKIEGVFINLSRDLGVGCDHQNIYQNTKKYAALFAAWAGAHGLPIVLMNYTKNDTDYNVKEGCKTSINPNAWGVCACCNGHLNTIDSTRVSEEVLHSFGVDPQL